MFLLPMHIAKVSAIADKKDSTRFALSGVHLKIEGKRWYAEATDSKRLLRVSDEIDPVKADEFPQWQALIDAPHDPKEKECLIPGESWDRAFRMLKRRATSKPILNHVALKIAKHEATFGATNLDSQPMEHTRLMEGKFPPTNDIIGQTEKQVRFAFAVDPKMLAESLLAMASMMGESKRALVYCDAKGEKPILIRARGDSGEEIELLMMPLCPDASDPKKPVPVTKRHTPKEPEPSPHVEDCNCQECEPEPKLDEDQRAAPENYDPQKCVGCGEVDCVCAADETDLEPEPTDVEVQPTVPVEVGEEEEAIYELTIPVGGAA